MILWQDFILDDEVGPLLASALTDEVEIMVSRGKSRAASCREKRLGSPDVMEDAGPSTWEIVQDGTPESVSIQETRQEQRPARMVGLSSLDFAQTGMEAGGGNRAQSQRRRGEG